MKRLRILIVLALVLVVVLGSLAIVSFRPREPRYQGRTLSEWIEKADKVFYARSNHFRYETDPEFLTASNAVKQIGTNAIPFLLDWIQAEDSPRKAKAIAWINVHAPFHWHIKSAFDAHRKFIFGVHFLGSESKPPWPALVQLTYSTNPSIRMRSFTALLSFQPDKKTLLPVLTRLINDPDIRVKNFAAYAFHSAYPEDAEAAGVYKMFPQFTNYPTRQSTTNQPPAK